MICVLWTSASGVTRDITQRVSRVKWSGQQATVARTLELTVVRPRASAGIEVLPIQAGDRMEFLHDGESLFDGVVWLDSTDSAADTAFYRCYDMGIYLNRNTASCKFEATTPEDAVLSLSSEYGFRVGVLAATGVQLTHTFIAQGLYNIIQTLYNRAAAQTGQRYWQRIIGRELHVIRLGMDSYTLVVQGGSNLLHSTVDNALDDTINRVRTVNDQLEVSSTLQDSDSIAHYGLLTRDVKEAEGAGETASGLFHPALRQVATVRCIGDHRSTTGRCVVIYDDVTGLAGLYHITKDCHTWERGFYTNSLTVQYDMPADTTEVGEAGTNPAQSTGGALQTTPFDAGSSAQQWSYRKPNGAYTSNQVATFY